MREIPELKERKNLVKVKKWEKEDSKEKNGKCWKKDSQLVLFSL